MASEEERFRFDPRFLATISILSLIGLFTNLVSLLHVKKSFDIRSAIYLNLFILSGLTTSGFGVTFLSSIVFLVDVDLAQNLVGCSFLHTGLIVPWFLAPLSVGLISYFRYCILKSTNAKLENNWQVGVMLLALTFGLLYATIFFLVTNYLVVLPYPAACLFGNQAPETNDHLLAFIGVPLMLTIPWTLGFDALTYFYLRNKVIDINAPITETGSPSRIWISSNLAKDNQIKLKTAVTTIPLKATIVSALSAIPLMSIVGIKFLLDLDLVTDIYLIFIVLLVTSILRIPMIVAVTLKKNQENQAFDKARIREERLKLELFYAQKERTLRKGRF